MTQFGASLNFVELPAVVELLANLGSTGRLRITQLDRSGEIVLYRGQMIAARMDPETGRVALESIALGFSEGELSFVEDSTAKDHVPLVEATEVGAYLNGLNAERRRLNRLIPSLASTPRLVDGSADVAAETEVITVGAAALQLIPALMFGHSLDQIARTRGFARTLRDVALLLEANLIRLEAPAALQRPVHVPAPPAARTLPTRQQAAAVRPMMTQRRAPIRRLDPFLQG